MRKRNKSKEDKVIQVPTLINIVVDELEKLVERNVIPSYHKTRFELTTEMHGNLAGDISKVLMYAIDDKARYMAVRSVLSAMGFRRSTIDEYSEVVDLKPLRDNFKLGIVSSEVHLADYIQSLYSTKH
tara:strand:+ start:1903 stop:2286 length:384 start_codon:yes stop_codon:yes gene_type:complete